ncbi:MAG: hypothetical protein EBU70_07255, partial [Actinobacteria bacterium]|nr:hypothetical protein [Actinomycetota bacterium]
MSPVPARMSDQLPTPSDDASTGRPARSVLDDALVADGIRTRPIAPPSRRGIVAWFVSLGGILVFSAGA